MLADVRRRGGPPIPGAPWTRRPAVAIPSGGVTPAAAAVQPAFLFDEHPNTPERMRAVLQQVTQLLNQFIRAGKLTVDFIGGNPSFAPTSDEVIEALGFTPADAATPIPTAEGIMGGGTLGSPEHIKADDSVLRLVNYGDGRFVVFFRNAVAAPTVPPSGGGILYSTAGGLKWLDSEGDLTDVAGGPL